MVISLRASLLLTEFAKAPASLDFNVNVQVVAHPHRYHRPQHGDLMHQFHLHRSTKGRERPSVPQR